MKKQISVVGAAVVHEGKVLCAKRGPQMSLPGMWEFPGGKIEQGESPEDALGREMREELLCEITVGESITTSSYDYDFGIVTLITFYATLTGPEPTLTEHAEIRWIPASELNSVNWAPADVSAVEIIMRELGRR